MTHSEAKGARVELLSSLRTADPRAKKLGRTNPSEYVQVSAHLRPRQAPPSAAAQGLRPPGKRQHLSREEFAKTFGAHDEDIAVVEKFARAHHLDVVRVDKGANTVVLGGKVTALESAFGTELYDHEMDGKTFRMRTGTLSIPSELKDIVVGVLGLDNRPVARPHYRTSKRERSSGGSFLPTRVATLYGAKSGLDGEGQCIAFVELGGGYTESDITTYFTKDLGLPKAPTVVAIAVDGGKNQPGVDSGSDGEVALDLEVAGAAAPAARLAAYFAPNTDAGFVAAINAAVHDSKNRPSIISISWGGPEDSWTEQARTVMEQAFQAAATVGITVFVAAGDNGSTDGVDDKKSHVDYPASSPNVTACGGTTLVASGAGIQKETVWNELAHQEGATGGGISNVFPVPSYQSDIVKITQVDTRFAGRGVPDVSGNADPTTGYVVRVHGTSQVIGGTSAVAPLYSGLLARVNQAQGSSVGFLNALLYAAASKGHAAGSPIFGDIVSGSNGTYSAQAGWDACTGWGTPRDGLTFLVKA